jgi:transcriptional regulator with XRE-family HTH domain
MSLGSRIRDLRKTARLTQQEIADKLGMGSSNFGHIENDRVIPSSTDLAVIAEILNTSTDYLLGSETDPTTPPDWATSKDKRDFKRMLEEDGEIMFDGVPISQDDKEKIKRVMEAMFWDAKKKNKRKPIDE